MIRALQFCKVDIIRCKSQLKLLLLFAVLAFFLSRGASTRGLFGVVYMVFAAIIFSAQPFNIEQAAESGFINMLPGTKRDRVMGRFFFSLGLLIFALFVGAIILVVINGSTNAILENYGALFVGIVSVGLAVSSLQNIIFYAIGKGKSQQIMGIIRMLPGFVCFFVFTNVLEKIQDKSDAFYVSWIFDHANVFLAGVFVAAVFLFVAGIFISAALIQKRDFN